MIMWALSARKICRKKINKIICEIWGIMAHHRRMHGSADIWPGFVDALATLLMVLIFLLLIFIISQLALNDTLNQRNKSLDSLNIRMNELAEQLSLLELENAEFQNVIKNLDNQLQASLGENEQLENIRASLQQNLEKLQNDNENFKNMLDDARNDLTAEQHSSAEKKEQLAKAEQQIALLNNNIQQLNEQLKTVNALLEESERKDKEKSIQLIELGKRLNAALASKVQELARFRSAFFGELKAILKDRRDVRVVGDRFVFQSEILFEQGDAALGEEGKEQLEIVSIALKEIMNKIPDDIDWILRVDGHTDSVPIHTIKFPSNWELSSARALSVVQFFIEKGIPPHRLVAAGFGEFRPLDGGNDEIAHRRNRRIELKLTQR